MVVPGCRTAHPYGHESSNMSILKEVLCSARRRCAAPFQGWRVNLSPAAVGSAPPLLSPVHFQDEQNMARNPLPGLQTGSTT